MLEDLGAAVIEDRAEEPGPSFTRLLHQLAGVLATALRYEAAQAVPVRIVRTHIHRLVPLHSLRAHPDIRLDIAQQMTQMQRAIGIRQRVGDEKTTAHGAATVLVNGVFYYGMVKARDEGRGTRDG